MVALTGVYAYRFEVSDVAARLAGEFFPSEPRVGRGGEVIVNRRLGGEFLVAARVNGARGTFLFDTGASALVLTADDARRAGVDASRLGFDVPVATANGGALAAEAQRSDRDRANRHAQRVRAGGAPRRTRGEPARDELSRSGSRATPSNALGSSSWRDEPPLLRSRDQLSLSLHAGDGVAQYLAPGRRGLLRSPVRADMRGRRPAGEQTVQMSGVVMQTFAALKAARDRRHERFDRLEPVPDRRRLAEKSRVDGDQRLRVLIGRAPEHDPIDMGEMRAGHVEVG